MKNFIIALGLVLGAQFAQAQKANNKITTSFWVAAACSMCEATIEKTLDTKGIVAADFVLATNQLTVTYNSKKITEDEIHRLLNEVGYDTEKSNCTDEQYGRVHGCCRYRELEKHE
ncbi:MAG: heavy-metal-associated domain-containing protein [Flavobacteriales bacterium]